MQKYIFVGERPSKRAIEINASWQSGQLAAKTLFDALRAIDINPDDHIFMNLWGFAHYPFQNTPDDELEAVALNTIKEYVRYGPPVCTWVVVGMGQKVQKALDKAGVQHLKLIHPAARGAIRKKEVYQTHVAQVLGQN